MAKSMIFSRRRSATVSNSSPEGEDQMEELEQQPPEGLPAGSGHACNSLTREMLSRSLSGAQSRTLSKDSKHKRFSSVDFSSLHLDSSGSSSSGSAEEPLQSPSPTSPIPSEGSGSSHKAGSRLKRVSSRIWGKQPGTDWNAVVPSTSSASPSKSIKAATHGSHIMQSASAAVAHDILPKRVVQGWFSGLHSSGSDTPTASTSSLSPSTSSNFAQRFSSPLKAMSTASPRTNGHVQPTPTSTNRLFDRKWVDKAANYLFDTDANVDKCPDDIWVLGVLHAGYRDPDQQPTDPFAPAYPASSSLSNPVAKAAAKRRRKKQAKAAAADRSASLSPTVSQDSAASASTSSLATPQTLTPNSSQTLQRTADATPLPSLAQTAGWPPSFFLDFTSRIQLTYRNGFPPIVVPNEDFQTVLQHVPSAANGAASGASFRDFMGSLAGSIGRRGDADGLTSDAGWGCMLRTGQSLLANALSKYHLGRDWRKPLAKTGASASRTELQTGCQTIYPADYAKYARMLSWFLDDPEATSPFSVHRFALVGKALGKEVGQWFGPSTAAGAIMRLCQDFPAAQMGVAAAVDATIYMPDILAASEGWTKPVLILLNLRLGLNGVNPIYHPPIKSLFSFPQSVGIAGGRPSSSYYFVGSQADSLFYIDPHHSKPAVPLPKKRPDGDLLQLALHHPLSPPRDDPAAEPDWEKVQHEQLTDAPRTQTPPSIQSPPTVEITSDESFVSEEDSWTDAGHNVETDFSQHGKRPSTSSNSSRPPLSAASSRSGSGVSSTTTSDAPKSERERALDDYFSRAYAPSELQSFHPERVRKIAISGLDPSMLVGFLVRSQEELDDWMRRSSELKPPLYSVQQNFPGWAKRGMGSRTISQTTAPPGSQSMPPRTQDSSASLTTTSDAGRSDSWDISDSEDEDDDLGAAGSTGDTSESQHAAGPIPDYSKGEKTRSRPSGEGSEEFEYDEALNQSAQTIEPTR